MQETLVQFLVGKIRWRRDRLPTPVSLGFPGGSADKESTCSEGDLGSIPGLGGSPGERKGYSLQYSGLENTMDSPWGHKESDTTADFHFHFHLHIWVVFFFFFLPAIWVPSCASSSLVFCMMYSACKLNKQGDNIPRHTPFLIYNQSVVPCSILTVTSCPPYRFLRRQVTVV